MWATRRDRLSPVGRAVHRAACPPALLCAFAAARLAPARGEAPPSLARARGASGDEHRADRRDSAVRGRAAAGRRCRACAAWRGALSGLRRRAARLLGRLRALRAVLEEGRAAADRALALPRLRRHARTV